MNVLRTLTLNQVPGEPFLISCLQKNVLFSINNKTIKKGKLLLFRKAHYFIQLCLATEKNARENMEIPIPFSLECHEDEQLLYFDYRLRSLNVEFLPPLPEKVSSIYFNKILEMQVVD
jgi:hypothetical protein